MIVYENREILSSLMHPPLNGHELSMPVCLESNFLGTDNLRSVLTDLNSGYALVEQLLVEVQRQSSAPSKES